MSFWGKLLIPHSTLSTPQSTLYTLHSSLYTLHPLHSPLHTLLSTLLTLHSTPHTLHFPLHTPQSTLSPPHCRLVTGEIRTRLFKKLLQTSVLRDCISMCFDICTINIRVSIPGVAFHITLLRLDLMSHMCTLGRGGFTLLQCCASTALYEVVCRCCCSLMFEGCCSVAGLYIFVMLWKTFRLCSVAKGRQAFTVHDSNTCRFRMHRSVVDSGMRFV